MVKAEVIAEVGRLSQGAVTLANAVPATGSGFITLGDYRIGLWHSSTTLGEIDRALLNAIEEINIVQNSTNGRLTVVITLNEELRKLQPSDRFSFGIQAVASDTANPRTKADSTSSNVARANVLVRM